MEKLFQKLKYHDLIIVEGLWGAGKTKLIKNITRQINLYKINEPDHLDKNIKKNISKWYFNEHLKNIKKALKLIEEKNLKIIMERSIISNYAYNYAKNKNIGNRSIKYIKVLDKYNTIIIFLHYEFNNVSRIENGIADIDIKNLIKKPLFYKNYIRFYKKILPKIIKTPIIYLKIK